ncbi:MAG TPA: aromatic amino acid lyase, partial [Chitinophaga sp.]|uniref:aromatic amino acid lyase n=1 Tax=Chitinophaga sp. TaxID=1869181 RepID=UPI002F91CB4F
MSEAFRYGIDQLTAGRALDIAAGRIPGILTPQVMAKVKASYEHVQTIVAQHSIVYGINTGFGPLCDTKISEEDTRILQYNILQSHSVGVGDSIPGEIARLMLITKVHALAQGYSGIAPATLERITWYIEQGIT